jgi:hypothetical protein
MIARAKRLQFVCPHIFHAYAAGGINETTHRRLNQPHDGENFFIRQVSGIWNLPLPTPRIDFSNLLTINTAGSQKCCQLCQGLSLWKVLASHIGEFFEHVFFINFIVLSSSYPQVNNPQASTIASYNFSQKR